MSHIWLEKYKPNNIKEILGNENIVLQINNWLKNFKTSEFSSILITGSHGIGKELIIKILLEKNNYYYDWIQYKDQKNNEFMYNISNNITRNKNRDIYIKDKKSYALILDDISKISLKREKKEILSLLKENKSKKKFPVILISNLNHNKLISDISKFSNKYSLLKPTYSNLKNLLSKIIKNENINISSKVIIKKIIKNSDQDFRKLVLNLYDIKNTFGNKKIEDSNYKKYLSSSENKSKDISLFDATKNIITKYSSQDELLNYYYVDKVLIPLTIYENYHKVLPDKSSIGVFNILKNVSKSISKGDIIETNIYTDQNWYLQNIHGFYTCIKTSYHINKVTKKNNFLMKFSNDLNQTSLKNINKKNILNLRKIFKNKSFSEIIIISKIVKKFINESKIEELYNLFKDYKITIKEIETFNKIDKTFEFNKLSIKNKRKLVNLFKTNNHH